MSMHLKSAGLVLHHHLHVHNHTHVRNHMHPHRHMHAYEYMCAHTHMHVFRHMHAPIKCTVTLTQHRSAVRDLSRDEAVTDASKWGLLKVHAFFLVPNREI